MSLLIRKSLRIKVKLLGWVELLSLSQAKKCLDYPPWCHPTNRRKQYLRSSESNFSMTTNDSKSTTSKGYGSERNNLWVNLKDFKLQENRSNLCSCDRTIQLSSCYSKCKEDNGLVREVFLKSVKSWLLWLKSSVRKQEVSMTGSVRSWWLWSRNDCRFRNVNVTTSAAFTKET